MKSTWNFVLKSTVLIFNNEMFIKYAPNIYIFYAQIPNPIDRQLPDCN